MQDEKAEKFLKDDGNSNLTKFVSKPVRKNEKEKFLWKRRQAEYHFQKPQSQTIQCDQSHATESMNQQVISQVVSEVSFATKVKSKQAKLDKNEQPRERASQGLGSKASELYWSPLFNQHFNKACEKQPISDLSSHERNKDKNLFNRKTSMTSRSDVLKTSSSNPSTTVANNKQPLVYSASEKENRGMDYVNRMSVNPLSHLPSSDQFYTKGPRKQPKECLASERKNRIANVKDPKSSLIHRSDFIKESTVSSSTKPYTEKLTVHLSKSNNGRKNGLNLQISNTSTSLKILSSTESAKIEDKTKISSSVRRNRCRRNVTIKKTTLPELDSQAITATAMPPRSYDSASFQKKYLKTGHNQRVRILHNPEISYIYKDKMCWHKTYRKLRQPKRLSTYHAAGNPSEIMNNCHKLPKVSNLECHISGLKENFKKNFQKLCKIIGVGELDFTIDRNENGAKVIRLKNSNDRNNLLTAFGCYVEEEGPVTQKIFGGRSNRKIFLHPGPLVRKVKYIFKEPKHVDIARDVLLSPKSWAAVLHGRRSFPTVSTERRDYGNIVQASKVLCHVF